MPEAGRILRIIIFREGLHGYENRLPGRVVLKQGRLRVRPITAVVRNGIEEFFTGSFFHDIPDAGIYVGNYRGADRDIHECVRIVAEGLVTVWSKFKGIEKSGKGPVFVPAASRQQIIMRPPDKATYTDIRTIFLQVG